MKHTKCEMCGDEGGGVEGNNHIVTLSGGHKITVCDYCHSELIGFQSRISEIFGEVFESRDSEDKPNEP